MKNIVLLALLAFLLPACNPSKNPSSAALKTETFRVAGNCGMCKTRIEKAARTAGATKAEWNADAQMLTASFDSTRTSADKIQQKIADVGHDTELYRSDDKTYEKLHTCCHYERLPKATGRKKN